MGLYIFIQPLLQIQLYRNNTKKSHFSIEMKISYTLFLTVMVAITIERCRAEYLLVAVDDDVVREPNNDDEIRRQEIEELRQNDICEIKPCCCDSCYPCDYELLAELRKIAEERKAAEQQKAVEPRIVPTPRECCAKAKVPEFCLGLCSPPVAMARAIQGKRINACLKYETIIEGCFQAAEPKIQDDQFQLLENRKCGRIRNGGLYRNLKSAKEQCMKNSKCIGVSVEGCDENNGDFELCDVESGLAFSRQGSCVYKKKDSTEGKDDLKVMDIPCSTEPCTKCSTDKDCQECAVCVITPTMGSVCIGCEGKSDDKDGPTISHGSPTIVQPSEIPKQEQNAPASKEDPGQCIGVCGGICPPCKSEPIPKEDPGQCIGVCGGICPPCKIIPKEDPESQKQSRSQCGTCPSGTICCVDDNECRSSCPV